ncbi:hypothetical protein Ahy_A05g024475 isoform D [Arachis hypogaea]|uniref:Uncharacterized protein n=1 Tax=Arachis hypogaea TaxID=3818 RepID=A0A445D6J4_ARAHY|nr:hypothetical protein Ahy_A05g024475 isoform D [Arachis hypogaea]
MGGRWRTVSLLFNRITSSSSLFKPRFPPPLSTNNRFLSFAASSAIPCSFDPDPTFGYEAPQDDQTVKIPVKAYFLCTSINLKGIQADNMRNVVPPSSRSSSNYVALRFCDFNPDYKVRFSFSLSKSECCVYMQSSKPHFLILSFCLSTSYISFRNTLVLEYCTLYHLEAPP